ncbi:MAG: hypothetical protein ABSF11_14320 [Methylocella sp.]
MLLLAVMLAPFMVVVLILIVFFVVIIFILIVLVIEHGDFLKRDGGDDMGFHTVVDFAIPEHLHAFGIDGDDRHGRPEGLQLNDIAWFESGGAAAALGHGFASGVGWTVSRGAGGCCRLASSRDPLR